MHQKVTFGEDGSPGAVDAWTWLTAHAWSGWDLDVVAVEKPLKSTSDSPMGYDHLHPWEPETPRDVPADCDFAGVSYFTAHHDARLVLGADLQSDLLVIGPRGKGLMKALHIGSTAEWLVQCPNTPTVIARAGGATRTIMLCIDGSFRENIPAQDRTGQAEVGAGEVGAGGKRPGCRSSGAQARPTGVRWWPRWAGRTPPAARPRRCSRPRSPGCRIRPRPGSSTAAPR